MHFKVKLCGIALESIFRAWTFTFTLETISEKQTIGNKTLVLYYERKGITSYIRRRWKKEQVATKINKTRLDRFAHENQRNDYI